MPKNNVKRKPLKAEDLAAKFNPNVAVINKVIYPEDGHLERISYLGKKVTQSTKIKFYDGSKRIFVVDKKDLEAAINKELQENFGKKGIKWRIPLYDYAIELDYKIKHELKADGDLDGIILWIDGKIFTP